MDFPAATAALRAADWTVSVAGRQLEPAAVFADLSGPADAAERAARLREANPGTDPADLHIRVVVDSLTATFELDEILYELREFSVTLEPSLLGFLLSFVRRFSAAPECVLPDRRDISASTPCIDAFLRHLEAVSERRAAPLVEAPERIRQVFDDDRPVEAADLLQVPRGRITESGMRNNIGRVLRFLAGDRTLAAVEAEFAAAELWQWVRLDTGVLDSGRIISAGYFSDLLAEEADRLSGADAGEGIDTGLLPAAARRLEAFVTAGDMGPSVSGPLEHEDDKRGA